MEAENDLKFLEGYYEHVVVNRGTDNKYAMAVKKVIDLVKGGSTINEAFDEVNKIVDEKNRQKSKPLS